MHLYFRCTLAQCAGVHDDPALNMFGPAPHPLHVRNHCNHGKDCWRYIPLRGVPGAVSTALLWSTEGHAIEKCNHCYQLPDTLGSLHAC